MPTESYNYSVPEESRYIAVRTPTGFINKENKIICISIQPSNCYTEKLFLDN